MKGRSGRKSAYQEKADAELLWQMFFGELSRDEVQNKLKSGKYSLKDVWISKGFTGNERVLIEIFRKLFPDKQDITSGGEPIPLLGGRSNDIPRNQRNPKAPRAEKEDP